MSDVDEIARMVDLLDTATQFIGMPENWLHEARVLIAWADERYNLEVRSDE